MKFVFLLCLLTSSRLILVAQKPTIGIVQDLEHDSILHASGYRSLVVSIATYFSPKNVSDKKFQEILQLFKKSRMSLYACNIFIPADLKLVGPDVDEVSILTYTNIVFQRCQAAGVKMIIWGSGGARRVPDGFDKVKASEQFISIARKVASLAARYKIVLALENLNSTETNFITTLEEAFEIVRKVNNPNLRLCADVYHMLKENEPPAVIEKAGNYIVHCDLAEKEKRAPPGTKGDDFRRYLKALRKIRFKGMIMLECQWENLSTQAGPANQYLQKQIDEVYSQK